VFISPSPYLRLLQQQQAQEFLQSSQQEDLSKFYRNDNDNNASVIRRVAIV
jgi:hypothetical protein